MKKITEETLNAIQENVRTRETQELDYKRDNLFKGSWKDFKIYGNKPNLIPNGWDGFEPYGSGENFLINSKTFEDWQVIQGTESTFEQGVYFEEVDVDLGTRIKTKKGRGQGQLRAVAPEGTYKISIYVKNLSQNRMFIRGGTPIQYEFIAPGEFVEVKGLYESMNYIEFGGDYDLDFIAWNPLIYKQGEQPLTVIKTPLENDLIRIQTWGGNSYIKLQAKLTLDSVGQYNISQYLDCNKSIFIGGNDGREFNEIVQNGFNVIQRNATNRNITLNVRTGVFDKELDFIASDMQVNMGDVPNPTMIVTPLSDGRERVQVYGATKDTKLVYSGNEGFIGEDYGLKTTIENNGIDLDLSTSLTEEKKRIEKGENKVNLQGELSTKLSIEIGVPSE